MLTTSRHALARWHTQALLMGLTLGSALRFADGVPAWSLKWPEQLALCSQKACGSPGPGQQAGNRSRAVGSISYWL